MLIPVFILLVLWKTSSADIYVTELDERERWRQSVAVRLTTRGPDKLYDVLRTRRDASVPVTFKRAIENVLRSTGSCTTSRKRRCTLAHNSPGLVGELHYNFVDSDRKIQGHSTQALLACRCLDRGCREAIVLEPRRIDPPRISGEEDVVCMYPRIGLKWKDCHTELLRVQEIDVDDVHYIPNSHNFSVRLGVNNFWRAFGQRTYIRNISSQEFEKLENISFQKIVVDFWDKAKTSSTGNFYVFGNDTAGDRQLPDKLVVESGNATECAKLFDYAHKSAAWMGAQQDQFAIAKNEESFIVARPEEPSSPDAFLAIGAGFAGLLASIQIWAYIEGYTSHHRKGKMCTLLLAVILALVVIGVEVATLVFSWVRQNTAENWVSFFTWYDASVALSSSSVENCGAAKQPPCSAAHSVYVATGLMGTATSFYPDRSKWTLLLISMVVVISLTTVSVCVFLVNLFQCWKASKRMK